MAISLIASASEINSGDEVTFTIKNVHTSNVVLLSFIVNGVNQYLIEDHKIHDYEEYIYKRKFTDVGTYEIYIRSGEVPNPTYFVNSNTVIITVNESSSYVLSSVGSVDVIDGDATVQVTLTEDDVGVSGETITLTDSESNSYTATTDNNGVATFNLTGIVESDVYTASYSGADSIDINVIVHDYSFGLVDDVIYTCNGNCNVRALLTDNNIGVSGETITLTGLTSNLTATTDNNGIATFNVTNINETKNISVEWGLFGDNGVIVYHDSSTLNGSLACLGMRLVDRLEQMGIEGISFTDGLTTLVDEILNINPSFGGIELTTAINCIASETEVMEGDSFTLTGLLEADYDDTSQADIDLEGFLTGATVKIMDGETVLGTTTTDSNGVYSFTYTTISEGTLTVKAVFEGTEYYDTCQSNTVNISVIPSNVLSVSADKTILSYKDGDSCTVTGLLTKSEQAYTGQTIHYEILYGDIVLDEGNKVTDSNGEIHVNYNSIGIGDVTVNMSYDNLEETITIEDCIVVKVTEQTCTSGSSTTIKSLGLDSIGDVSNKNFEISFQLKHTNKYGGIVAIGAKNEWTISPVSANYGLGLGTDTQSGTLKTYYAVRTTSTQDGYGGTISSNTYYPLKIVREGTSVKFYKENTLITTLSQSFMTNYNDFSIYGITWSEYSSFQVKDIKIKALSPNDLILYGDKKILSQADNDSINLKAYTNEGAGETVTMKVYDKTQTTLLDTLTVSDDGDGYYSATYNSQSYGDIIILCECGELQATYNIEDCKFYDSCTSSAKASYWTIPSGVTSTYSDDGWRMSASSYSQVKLTDKITVPCSVEFKVSDYNIVSAGASIIVYAYTNGETTPNQAVLVNNGSDNSNKLNCLGVNLNHYLYKNVPYRVEYTASTITVYENDVQIGTASSSVGLPTRFEIHMGAGGRYAVYKDVKVKTL